MVQESNSPVHVLPYASCKRWRDDFRSIVTEFAVSGLAAIHLLSRTDLGVFAGFGLHYATHG